MGLTAEKLQAVLRSGDDKACVALFSGATEDERAAVAELAGRWFKEEGEYFTSAARAATLASCSLSQLKKLGWRAIPEANIAYQVLADRRPPWVKDWAQMLLEIHPRFWPLVRRLERDGLCARPEIDNYWLGMLDIHGELGRFTSVAAGLLADPGLLEEVWRLFEIEGNGEFSLAARDKYSRPEGKWETALVQLADERKLARARLLDASLDTLARDFAQFRASWFSRFHEALQPTVAERAERTERYLHLLASKIPPTVSFALKALKVLDKAGQLPADTVVTHIGSALFARQKGTVLEALKLLDRAAQLKPDWKARATHCAAVAIRHESAQVQGAVLDLLEKHGMATDPRLVELLASQASELAASQRPRLLAWLGTANEKPAQGASKVEPANIKTLLLRARKLDRKLAKLAGVDNVLAALEENRGNIPALDLDPMAIPRLDPDKRIKPIENLDELIDVFAHVLEEPDDPMEVERVLDGVSRMCDQRPDDFAARTGPLRKRAQALSARSSWEPFSGAGPFVDLRGLATGWICGEIVILELKDETDSPQINRPAVTNFLSQRTLAVAQRAAVGRAIPLLGAPTHAGGWIDPRTLVQRAQFLDNRELTTDKADQVQSLLRLAPEHRRTALLKAKTVTGEFGRALRYALGEDEKVGPDMALWVAAVRTRTPFADSRDLERKHPGLGPDAGVVAKYKPRIEREVHGQYQFWHIRIDIEPPVPFEVAPELATVLIHPFAAEKGWERYHIPYGKEAMRWVRTVWPMQHESWFAGTVPGFADNLDWWEARWDHRTFLEPLLDPDVPLEPMALLMLALGLAAKEPGESGLATDALIAAIDDGRLDANNLGETLAFLAPMTKCARLARTLGQAARISPLHMQVIVQVVQRALRGDPTHAPRDLQTLLEFLKESVTELGEAIRDAEARRYLEKLKTSGKTARLIRELLALEERPDSLIGRQALLRALKHRIGRAESWSRRVE